MALISLTVEQQSILEQFVRRRNTPQWLVKRAMIILKLNLGASIKGTSRQLQLSRNTVRSWYRRWKKSEDNLVVIEPKDEEYFPLSERIKVTLSDLPRLGRPPTFCPEQIVQIVLIALENPQECGRPITHWTSRELADEAIKQGIVESVSARSVGRFLKGVLSSTSSKPLLASSRERKPGSIQPTNGNDL